MLSLLNFCNCFSFGLQESYNRARDNSFFNGLLRGGAAARNQNLTFDAQQTAGSQNISRTISDISDARSKKFISDMPEKFMDLPLEDSISDIIVEPFGHSTFGRLSKISKTTSFEMPSVQSDLSFDLGDIYGPVKESSPKTSEATEECHVLPGLARPIIGKSYSVNKKKPNLLKIPLPQSAASFYNGFSPQVEIVESCESIMRLNLYLKARRDDVNAGVPGRFLHAVIGQDVSGNFLFLTMMTLLSQLAHQNFIFFHHWILRLFITNFVRLLGCINLTCRDISLNLALQDVSFRIILEWRLSQLFDCIHKIYLANSEVEILCIYVAYGALVGDLFLSFICNRTLSLRIWYCLNDKIGILALEGFKGLTVSMLG